MTYVCEGCGQNGIADERTLCSKKCGLTYLIRDRRAQLDADRRTCFPADLFDREAERRALGARRENDREAAEAEAS